MCFEKGPSVRHSACLGVVESAIQRSVKRDTFVGAKVVAVHHFGVNVRPFGQLGRYIAASTAFATLSSVRCHGRTIASERPGAMLRIILASWTGAGESGGSNRPQTTGQLQVAVRQAFEKVPQPFPREWLTSEHRLELVSSVLPGG